MSVSTDQIDEIESQTTPTNQIESQSVPFDQIESQSVSTDQIESQTVPTDQIESQTASTNQLESQTESQTAQTDPLESQTPQNDQLKSQTAVPTDQLKLTSKINYFERLPIELVMMILELVIAKDIASYKSVINTCSRFRDFVHPLKNDILPSVYLDFYDNVLASLPTFGNVKVSVNELTRHFGPSNGAIDSLKESIAHKNWRSAWLILEKQKFGWFYIDKIFWRRKSNAASSEPPLKSNEWLHNRLYILSYEDRNILLSKDKWLNDNLSDAAQKLICEEIGTPSAFQTVLNSSKERNRAVSSSQ